MRKRVLRYRINLTSNRLKFLVRRPFVALFADAIALLMGDKLDFDADSDVASVCLGTEPMAS